MVLGKRRIKNGGQRSGVWVDLSCDGVGGLARQRGGKRFLGRREECDKGKRGGERGARKNDWAARETFSFLMIGVTTPSNTS